MVQYIRLLCLALLMSVGFGSVGQANESTQLIVSDDEGSTVQFVSNNVNVLVTKISTIPNGPNPTVDEQCERLTIAPALKSAKLISGKGWKITSELVYGPFNFISFAGQFEKIHTWCIKKQTNIAVFYRERLIAIMYTPPNATIDLGSLELLKTGQIAIYPTYIYDKKPEALLTFRNNEISIDKPSYSMACEAEGVIPNINGLAIKKARRVLFDYGWQPRNGKELEDMGDMEFWYSGQRTETPELVSCGAGGYLRCYYSYESSRSYLEVVTSGEPDSFVSGVQGRCKFKN